MKRPRTVAGWVWGRDVLHAVHRPWWADSPDIIYAFCGARLPRLAGGRHVTEAASVPLGACAACQRSSAVRETYASAVVEIVT